MCAEDDRSFKSDEEFADFVPAVFARSAEEAEEYCELLSDHDIPAIMGADELGNAASGKKKLTAMTRGVPVLVPEALLDEASEIIADREDADDFEPDDDLDDDEDEDDEDELELEVGEDDEEMDEVEEEEEEDDEEELDKPLGDEDEDENIDEGEGDSDEGGDNKDTLDDEDDVK